MFATQVKDKAGFKGAAVAWKALTEDERNEWRAKSRDAIAAWRPLVPAPNDPAEPSHPCPSERVKVETLPSNEDPEQGCQPTPPVSGGGDEAQTKHYDEVQQAAVVQRGAYRVEASDTFFLDRGTFETVYQGVHEASGQYVAVKIFHDQTARDIIGREIEIYKLCEAAFPEAHSPFPRLLWAAETGLRAIVLELFQCNLQYRSPSANEVKIVAKQLSRALHFLHKTHVHLDLKPGNILWSALERKSTLADFGSCEPIRAQRPLQSLHCTAQYRAPELWSITSSRFGGHLVPAVDIWSFGCTIWQLVTGACMFNGRSSNDIHDLIKSYTFKYRQSDI